MNKHLSTSEIFSASEIFEQQPVAIDQQRLNRQVSTVEIFKEPVYCAECRVSYLFTLKVIAECCEVTCPACHTNIDLRSNCYKTLVADVKNKVRAFQE